jgi:hypothetical protein
MRRGRGSVRRGRPSLGACEPAAGRRVGGCRGERRGAHQGASSHAWQLAHGVRGRRAFVGPERRPLRASRVRTPPAMDSTGWSAAGPHASGAAVSHRPRTCGLIPRQPPCASHKRGADGERWTRDGVLCGDGRRGGQDASPSAPGRRSTTSRERTRRRSAAADQDEPAWSLADAGESTGGRNRARRAA